MDEEQDPILEYLLDKNKTDPIQYKGRKLIPPGGLQEMLGSFKRFHLSREVPRVIEIEKPKTAEEELYDFLDD